MKIEQAEKLLVALMAIAMLCMRPTVVGEVYSSVSSLFFMACGVALFMTGLRGGRRMVPSGRALVLLAITIFIAYYLLIRTVFYMPEIDSSAEIKGFVIFISFCVGVTVLVCRKDYVLRFFDVFAIILIASCVSVLISASLFIVGIDPMKVVVAHMNYTYENAGDISFPFTFTFPTVVTWLGPFPRMSGLFREPGVFPMYACWAAAYSWRRGWSFVIPIVCALASVFCMSSIGALLAMFTLAAIGLMKMRVPPLLALGVIAVVGLSGWQIAYESEYLDLQSKVNSGSGSFEEREYLASAALDAKDIIFGDGLGFSIFTTGPISVVAGIRVFGLVYFTAFILSYIAAIVDLRLWVAGLLPAIFTVMLTQPVFREPCFIILLFSGIAITAQPPRRRAKPERLTSAAPEPLLDASPVFVQAFNRGGRHGI